MGHLFVRMDPILLSWVSKESVNGPQWQIPNLIPGSMHRNYYHKSECVRKEKFMLCLIAICLYGETHSLLFVYKVQSIFKFGCENDSNLDVKMILSKAWISVAKSHFQCYARPVPVSVMFTNWFPIRSWYQLFHFTESNNSNLMQNMSDFVGKIYFCPIDQFLGNWHLLSTHFLCEENVFVNCFERDFRYTCIVMLRLL